jgi:hypothetical protein
VIFSRDLRPLAKSQNPRSGTQRLLALVHRRLNRADDCRVVHHALLNIVGPELEREFIYDSYANRKGKGTHAAICRFEFFARKVSGNGRLMRRERERERVRQRLPGRWATLSNATSRISSTPSTMPL